MTRHAVHRPNYDADAFRCWVCVRELRPAAVPGRHNVRVRQLSRVPILPGRTLDASTERGTVTPFISSVYRISEHAYNLDLPPR